MDGCHRPPALDSAGGMYVGFYTVGFVKLCRVITELFPLTDEEKEDKTP